MSVEVIALISFLALVCGGWVYYFVTLPNEKKKENIKEWLKGAVTLAEREFGGGTGQLKLRMVYDSAIKEFPWIVSLVSFETFAFWVDEALKWMNQQIEQNKDIRFYIKGES